jgi:hypothetical protein
MQFLKSSQPIDASLVIGSFGQTKGYNDKAFSLSIARDPSVPIASREKPLRYGKLPEIHHIFKPDPKSPNILITLIFTGAVLATVPMLLGTVWFCLPLLAMPPLTVKSGFTSAQISTTCQQLCKMLLYLTLYSTAPLFA